MNGSSVRCRGWASGPIAPRASVSRLRSIKVPDPPEGFHYAEDFLTEAEESDLVRHIRSLPLKEFEFYGYLGKRRVISFGWRYDHANARLERTDEIPQFVLSLRERAAAFAGLAPADLPHVLFTEYTPGTQIGWHRDRPVFDQVIGVSLLSPCPFRLRRRTAEAWERYTHILAARSVYLLGGSVRRLWEHSIPPMDAMRYSVTFRSLRAARGER